MYRGAVKSGSSQLGISRIGSKNGAQRVARSTQVRVFKELHFNTKGETLKKMQAGVEKLANVVGVTLGPKGRNVVLEAKYGPPRIVNDGVTVAREVELEDPVENVGSRLVKQAASKTNDTAGDGTTTATILASALIEEGMKVIAAGANPVQITRGMDKIIRELVNLLREMSQDVSDEGLCDVATVSAGNNEAIGKLISDALGEVGRSGVVTMEESRTQSDNLYIVEGMQFERGFISPYFVTDPDRMVCEYENCKLLLVDKKISSARDIIGILEATMRGGYPLLIMAEDIEQEALATLVVNKLRANLKVVAVRAPGFGERKTQYLEDIAIMTGATLIKDELGISLDKADAEVLGNAQKVEINKEYTVVVGDGTTNAEIEARVKQLQNQAAVTSEDYEKEKLNERTARLSGGVAILQVGAQTETELKDRKLRVEDALNATRAAVEEGIVVGGGCALLRLSTYIDETKDRVCANEEQRIGAEIVKKALVYPLKLIAENAGVNGSIVMSKVLDEPSETFGYNAATGEFCDLLEAGIIDPAKVVRCEMENAASVAKTFLMADVVITEIPEKDAPPAEPQMDQF